MANRATTNIFELLSDEPTPVAKPEVAADKKPAQTGAKDPIGSQKAAAKPTNRPAAAGSKPAAQSNGAVQGSTSANPAPYRKERSEGRDRHTRDGRGRGRGGRGRDFDHHLSGTGRPATENKKRGGGGHNWGKQDEAWDAVPDAAEQQEPKTDAAPADADAKPTEADAATAAAVEKKEPVEEEPKQVSYEDFLAQKAQAAKALAEKYNLKTDKRTVSAAAADLKNVTVLDKKKEEAEEDASSAAGSQVRKDAKIKDGSHLLNFKQPVEERPSRGGRGRGGRGGSRGSSRGGERGRGGRGGSRGGARGTGAPRQGGAPQRGNFDATQVDDAAFPSLGAGKA